MKVVTTEVLWSCLLLKRWPAAKESAVSLNKLLTSQLSGAEMPDRRQGHKAGDHRGAARVTAAGKVACFGRKSGY